jgi:hypothetical protein
VPITEPEVVWHEGCPQADADDLSTAAPVMVLTRSRDDPAGSTRVYTCSRCGTVVHVNYPPIAKE